MFWDSMGHVTAIRAKGEKIRGERKGVVFGEEKMTIGKEVCCNGSAWNNL